MRPTVLLNPGPVNVSSRVRAALAIPDICHREPEYADLQDAIRARLLDALEVPRADYTAILLTGSGTSAVEAMIASSVPEGGRLLVVSNGVYGERIADMAAAHRIAFDRVEAGWTTRPSIDRVASALAAAPCHALAIVHHETTAGLLNDLEPVAGLCRASGVRLLVDAVSALGGERFDFAGWQPAAVASTANKCIQGVPGLSFVIVRRDVAREMAGYAPRSVSLHLPRYSAEQDRRSTPFTPAVQVASALLAALDELTGETLAGRIGRFARASALVRDGLEALGFDLLLPIALRSTTLTAVKVPPGLTYADLHDALRRDGFVIYAGQGPLAGAVFRVATMGAVDESEYRRFLGAVDAAYARAR